MAVFLVVFLLLLLDWSDFEGVGGIFDETLLALFLRSYRLNVICVCLLYFLYFWMRTFRAVLSVWVHRTQVMVIFLLVLDWRRAAQVGILVSFLELAHRGSLAPEDTCTKFGFARLKAI